MRIPSISWSRGYVPGHLIEQSKFNYIKCQLRVEKRVQVSGCRVQAVVFILCRAHINLLLLLFSEFLTLNPNCKE